MLSEVENSTVVLTPPCAVIPPWPGEPFALTPPPVETVAERVDRLKRAIQRRFGGKWREFKPEQSEPYFADVEWDSLGERGHVAQLLAARGLTKKARRYADCRRKGQRATCFEKPG